MYEGHLLSLESGHLKITVQRPAVKFNCISKE